MNLVRNLVRLLVAVLVLPALAVWYVDSNFFQLPPPNQDALKYALPIALLSGLVVAGIAVRWLASPIAAALRVREQGTYEARLDQRAALAALQLPSRIAYFLLLLSGALIALVDGVKIAHGLGTDLAFATAAEGIAFGITAALLGYCVAAIATAPMLIELGSVELQERDTMRGKLIVLGVGQLLMAVLLLASVNYARYRDDADRQYVAGAQAVLDRAAESFAAKWPVAAAELVSVSIGAPTAVLGNDGLVLARSGGDDSLTAGPIPTTTTVEVVRGGWRLWRPGDGITLVSFLADAPLRVRREAFWKPSIIVTLVLFGVAAILVGLIAQSLTDPIGLLGTAAGRIASGDLTARPPSVSRDELGQLAADFRGMAQGLAALVVDVQAAAQGVHAGTQEMGEIGERVKGGAREEHERVVAVQAAVEAMQGSVAMVGRGVDTLADYVHSTSSAVSEMAAALIEVRRQGAELERRMDGANEDLDRLAGTGRRAHAQLATLDALADSARGTLSQVSSTIAGLETSAVGGQLSAAQTSEIAEHAGTVVSDTVDGIEKVREAVADAKKRVTVLGRRSDDIDKILDFIGEVAGRTNLLSLNASIIATQAGEHGKAFAVVADQIRELAAQISSSTKSIGEIIRAVRDDVNGTARLIDRGDELASDGVAAARRSLVALQEIRAATAQGHETASSILEAVQAHVRSTRDVATLVGSVAENSAALSEAVQMISKSVAAVGSVSRGISALADQVSRALEEQSGVGQRQLQSLQKIDATLSEITRATENHGAATHRVLEALAHLNRTAELHEAAVVELSGVAGRLSGRSRALAERVGRFKI
jgi:methyl-accepting chemotaxis protein